MRRKTRNFFLGKIAVGSDAPVSIQSMCNTPTSDTAATSAQIEELYRAGCDIVRVSVDKEDDIRALYEITAAAPMPVVADIQFSPDMAVKAVKAGCAAVRLNPGIVHDPESIRPIAALAVEKGVPIRVGANAGSLPRHGVARRMAGGMDFEDALAEELVEAAVSQCRMLEKYGVRNIKAALKCSDPAVTVKACRRFAEQTDYPLHLGLTEAGTPRRGILKSASALGGLLLDGIGDTIRISLTAAPVEEIRAAREILESCGIRSASPELVSCPTCGRTEIDLIGLVNEIENRIGEFKMNGGIPALAKVAVMGCPVNGPGEARDADLGISGSRSGELILFKKGEVVCRASREEIMAVFMRELAGK